MINRGTIVEIQSKIQYQITTFFALQMILYLKSTLYFPASRIIVQGTWNDFKTCPPKNTLSEVNQSFFTEMPDIELGVNDISRMGLEVVGRHDILPVPTEQWIRYEDVDFHSIVDKKEFEKNDHIIK